MKKLEEHDVKFDQVDEKLVQIDKKFVQIDKRFEQVDKRFDQIDGQIDFLVKKVLEHDDRLERIEENMATKQDLRGITDTLDEILKITRKTDQELTFMGSRLRRVEDQTEQNTLDIQKIKPILGLI